ncbi:fimbria/pilus periplasmic chaperone [Pantoea sp. JK]|uniref:fimbria/pilus periplasmic chaperone n=1 Tax=Pantoea sp. JK TaxID=2871703 RepID=UPI0022384173|nr:fimbria/pilus periplasmic chaperone [Pantoea sp. JK]MCW6030437.1 fimbria/pilus periplasmic chaperone [Pantoea sp. JK]
MKLNALAGLFVASIGIFSHTSVQAAIGLDRTRVVYNGGEKSISLNVNNNNAKLPYLAQAWLEDEQGKKMEGNTSPLMVLPPIQRVEPKGKGQVKIQSNALTAKLPQDRESLFYFNMREIPPKSEKSNVLQIALQTRIKLFYRPALLAAQASNKQNAPFQEKITLSKKGDRYQVNNPTPYYVTLIGASAKAGEKSVSGFEAVMLAPNSHITLGGSAAALGNAPVLTYINDYGGQPQLIFGCQAQQCVVKSSIAK